MKMGFRGRGKGEAVLHIGAADPDPPSSAPTDGASLACGTGPVRERCGRRRRERAGGGADRHVGIAWPRQAEYLYSG